MADLDRLWDLADTIQDIANTLDNSSMVCNCCGRPKYNNFDEHQKSVELYAVAEKLRRFARTGEPHAAHK